MSSASHRRPVDRDDPITGAQARSTARVTRRPASSSGAIVATVVVACPATVMNRNVKRTIVERDVRRRSGADRNEPLPRGCLPVGIRAEGVAELGQTLLGRGVARPVRASRHEALLELVEDARACFGEVLGIERPLHAIHRSRQSVGTSATAGREASLGIVRESADASRGSSRSRRAGSPRCRTRCRSASFFTRAGGKPT